MASSRRTFDTDSITLRTVYAKNGNNTNIPALRALTADGSGGTTWRIPSSFGTTPSFNQIITDAGTFTADLSYNVFRLTSGEGIGMTPGPIGSNQTYLFAKAFGQVDVSGADSLYSFSNGVLTPSFKIATTAALQLRTNPLENTLFIDGPLTTQISSGYYGFNKILVIPTVSTINSNVYNSQGNSLFANSPSTQLTVAGIGDVILSSFYSTNSIFFTVSSYSASEFLAVSSIANSVFSSITSTLGNQYVLKSDFSSATTSVSTLTYSNASSVTSTIYGISSFFVTQFNILTGLINARATIVQLNSNVSSFQTSISSFSTNYIELNQYLSSTAGIVNQVSSIVTISNVSSIYLFGGTLYNFSTGSILYDQSDVSTLSTAAGVSISTTSNALFTQLAGNLVSTTSTVNNLGTIGYVSSLSLFSTVRGLGTFGYISSQSLTSTIEGLGTLGYISTSSLDAVLRSTTKGINENFGSFGYISSLSLESTLQSTTGGIINYLGSFNYISTATLNSTLQSTTKGVFDSLGSFGYISSVGLGLLLASTVTGLGTLDYISTPTLDKVLQSTYIGFLGLPYISSASLTSTTSGLGTLGYISTQSLVSTTSSLFLTISTNLLSSISLRSSILYSGCNGSLFAREDNNNLFFSTAYVNLGAFSSFITPRSKITLDINENILFSDAPTQGVNTVGYLSSLVVCEENFMNNTLINDAFVYQFTSGNSNFYSKNLTFLLDTNFVRTSYTSTLAILHQIPGGFADTYFSDYTGFILSNITILNSSNNSIFVTILN
jgi:hypothetical protein